MSPDVKKEKAFLVKNATFTLCKHVPQHSSSPCLDSTEGTLNNLSEECWPEAGSGPERHRPLNAETARNYQSTSLQGSPK